MAVNPLEAHVGYWLRFVSNHVSHAFRRKIEARGVTVAEWVVLRELFDRSEAAPSEVADRLGLSRGAVSKLVDRLAAKALLARQAGGPDKRYQALALTEAGRALVPELAALADRNDAEFFGELDAATRATVLRAMQDIARRHDLRATPIE